MTFFPDAAVPPGRLAVGVVLPSPAVRRAQKLPLAEAARHAEQAGLDLVAYRDAPAGEPSLDAAVALAAVAAATEHITVVSEAYAPALRPPARAAEQIASLQYVADGRLVLGVGTGGGRARWAAAGVPYEERGRRTDATLRLLPRLLAGDGSPLPYEQGGPAAGLPPCVPMPPVWVSGNSRNTVRRAARLGDGWYPALAPPAEVAAGTVHLAELAAAFGRPAPSVVVGTLGALGTDPDLPTRTELATDLATAYGSTAERRAEVPVTGDAREAAEHLHSYCGAGVSRVVMTFAGGDWRHQVELLAEVRGLVG
ncbi:LLM class flavin-dependent oxidoreductase [Streptomyces albofaciens JCM 4342]|uniref:LLM class flavin-dependent oxidoreductase n=1 Tax=Streptomyces albofaciens TaxID=66866 RepID=UPI00123BADDA|nr:LLM class flavin-dependent oxidoreductase [Streptomyces albofaciens]KAA6213088.1 LLM class flavin-dependent oxidoreductase [Streptomyces albofaciens JCM 4342]